MRFPQLHELHVPCEFVEVVAGELHPDGRRYLPLLVFALDPDPRHTVTPAGFRLGVVDRHHRVDLNTCGRRGMARLVCALGRFQPQLAPFHLGWQPERASLISTMPTIFAQIEEVLTWEHQQGYLAHESLYAELRVVIGQSRLGFRNSLTAPAIREVLGKDRLAAGDFIQLERPRIDILAFEV